MGDWVVVVTNTAYEDVRAAALYMRERLGSPGAASKFIDEFEKKVTSLSSMPEGRPLVADFELAMRGYRWCPLGDHFMMMYIIDNSAGTVTIERVIYGARDWRALL